MKKRWFIISLLTRFQSVNDWVNEKVSETLKSLTFNLTKLDTFVQTLRAQGFDLNKETVAHVINFAKVVGIPITAFDEAKERSEIFIRRSEDYIIRAKSLEIEAKDLRDEAADYLANANKLQEWSKLA
jgi:hypothetical protein